LAADAQDYDGTIAKVEFYNSSAKVGETTNAPYQLTLSNLAAGVYVFSAVATDNKGGTDASDAIWVQVFNPTAFSYAPAGAVWRYFDRTNDLGTAWRSNTFNDLTWSSGAAMLGFGDANGLWPTTTIANNQQWTTYFRRTFQVPDASLVQSLHARLMRDDGAVVYLNGVEIWRDNMPAGLITNPTPAATSIGGTDESVWLSTNLSPAALVTGTNLLAVEIHQINLTSSDVTFNFELTGSAIVRPTALLTIAPSSGTNTLVWPAAAGDFTLFTSTSVAPSATWVPATNQPVFINGQWAIPVPKSTPGPRFYRLQSP